VSKSFSQFSELGQLNVNFSASDTTGYIFKCHISQICSAN